MTTPAGGRPVPGRSKNAAARSAWYVAAAATAALLVPGVLAQSGNSADGLDPAEVRAAARAAGLDSLANIAVPVVPNLGDFLRPGAEHAALQLGKALFWDMQVGSDGVACASCHFHAGADNRVKNQVNPGTRGGDDAFGVQVTEAGRARGLLAPEFGPNYTVRADDFPFFLLEDGDEKDFGVRVVLRDSNDVLSSHGVFRAQFEGVGRAAGAEYNTPLADAVMSILGVNTRRVEPRHTPTTINAVFTFSNFWDGRARNEFNGATPFGLLDEDATILVNERGRIVEKAVVIPNASLASQAVGPPVSEDEMSFVGRRFADIGKKVLSSRPLSLQVVHAEDSVLGPLARPGGTGLTTETYAELVQQVFRPEYWDSEQRITYRPDGTRVIHEAGAPPEGAASSMMEANFPLFFGLAVQIYESVLVSDQTPFDAFMEGDDGALDGEQLRGLLVFLNGHESVEDGDPLFRGVAVGNCVSCHGGPEFTNAGITTLRADGDLALAGIRVTPELEDGQLVLGDDVAFHERGFSNIGVRPTREDPGRGSLELGKPLSAVRQRLEGLPFAPELPDCGAGSSACPQDRRVQADGAFKIPGLRNVELTGPYFHNGGTATLEQVIDFYGRHGDFGDVNLENLDSELARIDLGEGAEQQAARDALVRFLIALADERVREERAPFDHPHVTIPNGSAGDHKALDCIDDISQPAGTCERWVGVPAVGTGGRPAEGLEPLQPFLEGRLIEGFP